MNISSFPWEKISLLTITAYMAIIELSSVPELLKPEIISIDGVSGILFQTLIIFSVFSFFFWGIFYNKKFVIILYLLFLVFQFLFKLFLLSKIYRKMDIFYITDFLGPFTHYTPLLLSPILFYITLRFLKLLKVMRS
jgi:hypothetical protein